MFKKFSLVIALVLMAGSAMADDAISSADLAGISDANNAVVEANLNVDVDALATARNDEAVEACFRGWRRSYGCYNYCYNFYPCYTYNYCYTPCYQTYLMYRPVVYTYPTYSCFPLYTWGCY